MAKKETVSIRMDGEIWKQIKLFAIEKDMNISNYVEMLLLSAMVELEQKNPDRKV